MSVALGRGAFVAVPEAEAEGWEEEQRGRRASPATGVQNQSVNPWVPIQLLL